MDKRKKRTSINQYLMYIELLEKDETFRTGMTPRDAEPNCMNNKWKELSLKLNTCPNGPVLLPEEWKKRLNDWKNSTRCKYRRSVAGEKGISMSPLEKKALSLFGKTPVILRSAQTLEFKSEAKALYEAEKKHREETKSRELKKNELLDDEAEGAYIDDEFRDDVSVEEIESIEPKSHELMNGGALEAKRRRTVEATPSEVKFLCPKNGVVVATQSLSTLSADSTNNIATVVSEPLPSAESVSKSPRNEATIDDLKEVAMQLQRIADIKLAKLRFEIAKHKFNNPGFEYPSEPL